MIRAWPGIICTISSMIRNEPRNRNRNLAAATAASSDTTEAISTAARVTARLLRKNSHTVPIPAACPLITWEQLPRVGWAGSRRGVGQQISGDGVDGVGAIQRS